ncbi:PrsW family glutamic-type intramembrane protease [Streptomyces sp. NPDC001678]|uniref:PrsW family glutamic-type intramembrane protease n=1 Tax=Streptomyces sp. NPDC001678 TaxID=3364599 RepID=UPI0036A3C1E6
MRSLASLSLSLRDDAVARSRALLIARIVIALYFVELLANVTRPHRQPGEGVLSIFYKPSSDLTKLMKKSDFSNSFSRLMSVPTVIFWLVLAGIAAAVVIQVFAAITRPADRRAAALTWLTLGCLLLPFGLLSLVVVFEFFPSALACVPSTAFVLLLLRGSVRFARVPLGALLMAFGWGALIVFSLGRVFSNLASGTMFSYLGPAAGSDPAHLLASTDHMLMAVTVHLSLVNTIALASGVALLLVLFRYRITDALTGLILGASMGLGYAFVDSLMYIKVYGSFGGLLGSTGGFEYWIRQSIGLLGGQVTFGALLGAGFCLAARARQHTLPAVAALMTAFGGSTAAEVLSGWLSGKLQHSGGGPLDTLVVSPLLWLLPQLPFIALAVVLLVYGLRERGVVLRAVLAQEAEAGSAVTAGETSVLGSPTLRLWALVGTWRRHGRGTALALYRLQSAQLELAGCHAQEDPPDTAQEERSELRGQIMSMKGVRAVAS